MIETRAPCQLSIINRRAMQVAVDDAPRGYVWVGGGGGGGKAGGEFQLALIEPSSGIQVDNWRAG